MLGLVDWIAAGVVATCVVGCGDDAGGPGGGTSSGTGPSATSEVASSTGAVDGPASADGSTGTSGSSSETGTPPPETMCIDIECGVECTIERDFEDFEDSDGNACTCPAGGELPGTFDCDLPQVCGDFGDNLCKVQGVRWGLVGRYRSMIMDKGAGMGSALEVLEPGLVHGVRDGFVENQCCNGDISREWRQGFYPRNTPASDDPFWTECIAEMVWSRNPTCVAAHDFDAEQTCANAPIDRCPEPLALPDPGAPCEQTCPMANDGVCDEPGGSGLCPAGCDPIDCTCLGDTVDVCDETVCFEIDGVECQDAPGGGTCPIRSDPDCDNLYNF